MPKTIRVSQADPSWPLVIKQRKAILWLGPDTGSLNEQQGAYKLLERVGLHPWSAVFVDGTGLPLERLKEEHRFVGDLVLRVYETDAGPDQLPPNRLPIFALRGATGRVGPGDSSDPRGLMVRFQMLERAPQDAMVIAIGASSPEGLAGLAEAAGISAAFRNLVVLTPSSADLTQLERWTERLVNWTEGFEAFFNLLDAVMAAPEAEAEAAVYVRHPAGGRTIDLLQCIDASHPITESFEIVPAWAVLSAPQAVPEHLDTFLTDPTSSWTPYAAGIPYPRHNPYRDALQKTLGYFPREGAAASYTAWIPAEDGSGATAALRHLALDVAQAGYPVLIARPSPQRFDFGQLSAFLKHAADRFGDEGISVPDTPWIIAFDSEHALHHWPFITGLCNGLKKLLRSVVVVSVRPVTYRDEERDRALGTNRTLGPTLLNSVSPAEAEALGKHLSAFLPSHLNRTRDEWLAFLADSIRATIEGTRSLFWVALRFWLFRVPAAGESLRHWLASKLEGVASHGSNSAVRAALLEIAAFAKNRLVTPTVLLDPDSVKVIDAVARDRSNALGLRILRGSQTESVTYSHPLIAEEILRIAQGDPELLAAVDKQTCFNLLDLELHLFGRLIQRPEAGGKECAPIIEELVTTALRVDPREAPRNYEIRDRIVDVLETVPDSLLDTSQVFNHHLAKARRHLAINPPDGSWDEKRRREEFQLAENSLLDALENIDPGGEERRESPLNLNVSLALTYDARARFEEQYGNVDQATHYKQCAEQRYQTAQDLDADNSYVLENFARFKLRLARGTSLGEERVRLIVEAIGLLELERESEVGSRREEPILTELADAYNLLREGEGERLLVRLTETGSEAAAVALARIALRERGLEGGDDASLDEADSLLVAVPAVNVTWRSRLLLYKIVSCRRPYDLRRRLEVLEELDSLGDLVWPLQMRLEYGILLFQVGDPSARKKGQDVFRKLREDLPERSGSVRVPDELRFLRDPSTGFRERLRTSMVVQNISDPGRIYFAVPEGWHTISIPFRHYLFGGSFRRGSERDCFIQFNNFGPQAVPITTE